MSHLYWSCLQGGVDELARLLAENGREATEVGLGCRMPVISVSAADRGTLRLTAVLLAQGRIASAALTSRPLSDDELWLAAEWRRCLVVERAELSGMEAVSDRLQVDGEHPQRGLVIFRTRETGGELAAAVRERPRDYYGDLADPLAGGASALYAAGLEAARARGLAEDRIVVGPLQALGFEVDAGASSVVAWRKKAVIAAEAVGFSLGSEAEVGNLFAEHGIDLDRDALAQKADGWRGDGLRFGVALVLRGLEDPPVVIPVGSVYQQPSIGSPMQNLAVGRPAAPMVAAGATVPLILPAWCINRTLSPPSGPLVPTPLVATTVSRTQVEVWDRIESRYRGEA